MSLRTSIARLISPETRVELACRFLPREFREPLRRLVRVPYHRASARTLGECNVWNYDLRRVAHILEKGLCHPAWTPGHSGPIARELESLLERTPEEHRENDPTWKWARAILDEYQEAQLVGFTKRSTSTWDDSASDLCGGIDELLRSRRSIRNYRDKPVSNEVLGEILESINWCSTSCNRQPAMLYVVRSPERITSVMQRFAGSTGFSRNVPCAIVFCGDMRAYTMPMEMYLPAIDVSLGIQSCALAAHVRGLSLTLMSWAHHSEADDQGLRHDLGIPAWEQIIVGGLLGYPTVTLPPPGRKSAAHTATIID